MLWLPAATSQAVLGCTAPTASPALAGTPPGRWASPPCCQVLLPRVGVACLTSISSVVGLERGETFTGRERGREKQKRDKEGADTSHLDFCFLSPSVSHHAAWTSQGSPTLGLENHCIGLDSEKGDVGSSRVSESKLCCNRSSFANSLQTSINHLLFPLKCPQLAILTLLWTEVACCGVSTACPRAGDANCPASRTRNRG